MLDLNAILRKKLTAAQRVSRHLWRMCFAFFIATGSFSLGQQDVMPRAVRGSPILFVLAFAPLAVMLFWLMRLRFANAIARSRESGVIFSGGASTAPCLKDKKGPRLGVPPAGLPRESRSTRASVSRRRNARGSISNLEMVDQNQSELEPSRVMGESHQDPQRGSHVGDVAATDAVVRETQQELWGDAPVNGRAMALDPMVRPLAVSALAWCLQHSC